MTPDTTQKLPVDIALWRENLAKSATLKKTLSKWWDKNLEAYAPKPSMDLGEYGSNLNTNRDFTLVERKKADLFFQRPDVTAVPSPLFAGQEPRLEIHTNILNEKLGRDGVDAKRLAHQVLFDVLCPSGTGWTVMGYESVTVPVPQEQPQVPGAILGLSQPPQQVPVPLYENCFWTWISPKQGIVPHDARTVNFDDWPWIGYEFEMAVRLAKRKGWVPEDFKGTQADPETRFQYIAQSGSDAVVRGQMIFYKSAIYRDDRVHPLHQTQLVLIDGRDEAAVHQDSPYQTLTEQGDLTPDSLIGFPIHPCALRTMTDAPYVQSDCTISRPLVNELNRFREDMIAYRDACILRWQYNTDTLPTDALSKIVRSPIGGFIGVPGEAFAGEGAIKELPHGSFPRENFTSNDYIDNDLARTHGLDANQSGAMNADTKTATESQLQQSNANARLGFERGNFLDWYIRGCTKYSQLLMKFLPIADATKIVGQQAAADWNTWRKTIPAALAFTAMPDSALQSDLAWERKRNMEEFTFLVNSPYVNQSELVKSLLTKLHYPQKVFVAQPPEKQPDTPKVSLAIATADLNQYSPSYANVYQVLTQLGFKDLQPPAAQPPTMGMPMPGQTDPQMAHGGKLPAMESLSKHHADQTGAMQGTGAVAGTGAGGVM